MFPVVVIISLLFFFVFLEVEWNKMDCSDILCLIFQHVDNLSIRLVCHQWKDVYTSILCRRPSHEEVGALQ